MKCIVVIRDSDNPYLWFLDNGHGYDTPGKRSGIMPDGRQCFEFEFNRDIVGRISWKLFNAKKNYVIVVPEKEDISLRDRSQRMIDVCKDYPMFKNRKGISVHGNGYHKESANGIEVWTLPGQTPIDKTADIFMEKAKVLNFTLRTDFTDKDADKEKRFSILWYPRNYVDMMLTENGFYTNYEDFKKMMDNGFREKIADVHVESIIETERLGI